MYAKDVDDTRIRYIERPLRVFASASAFGACERYHSRSDSSSTLTFFFLRSQMQRPGVSMRAGATDFREPRKCVGSVEKALTAKPYGVRSSDKIIFAYS